RSLVAGTSPRGHGRRDAQHAPASGLSHVGRTEFGLEFSGRTAMRTPIKKQESQPGNATSACTGTLVPWWAATGTTALFVVIFSLGLRSWGPASNQAIAGDPPS